MEHVKQKLSKRLIVLVVSGVLLPLAVEFLGVSLEVAMTVASLILGYFGFETLRPSGHVGLMGNMAIDKPGK